MAKNVIRWKLSEIMARHRIKGKDLAIFLGISANSVSVLKRAEVMPEIGGERWEQICQAINQLSCRDEECTPFDLIEYIPSENKPINEYDQESPGKTSSLTNSAELKTKSLSSNCNKSRRGAA